MKCWKHILILRVVLQNAFQFNLFVSLRRSVAVKNMGLTNTSRFNLNGLYVIVFWISPRQGSIWKNQSWKINCFHRNIRDLSTEQIFRPILLAKMKEYPVIPTHFAFKGTLKLWKWLMVISNRWKEILKRQPVTETNQLYRFAARTLKITWDLTE